MPENFERFSKYGPDFTTDQMRYKGKNTQQVIDYSCNLHFISSIIKLLDKVVVMLLSNKTDNGRIKWIY